MLGIACLSYFRSELALSIAHAEGFSADITTLDEFVIMLYFNVRRCLYAQFSFTRAPEDFHSYFEYARINFLRKYKKRLLFWCLPHFISDIINNMDNMRISGIEHSLVILSQTK